MRTSIVIISWNSARVLPACVASIREHVPVPEREIIIVDNASTDTGYLEAYRHDAEVRVILSRENLGYARAANLGLAQATGESLVILNPDIVFRDNPFPGLARALHEDPRLGAVGPLLRDESGAPQVEGYYRKFPAPLHYLLSDTILSRLSLVRALARNSLHERVRETGTQRVDQIPGAFLFFGRECFEPGAWMNEAYFLWMEDVDFCRRLLKAGRGVAVVANESVTHLGGASFRLALTSWKRRVFVTSYITYARLHFGLTQKLALALFIAADATGRIAAAALSLPWRGRDSLSRMGAEAAILRALSGVLRRPGDGGSRTAPAK